MKNAISLSLFHQQLLRCFGEKIPNRMMIALSGGVDSMCLAYLLSQYKKLVNPSILLSAVTIDHGFRKDSASEAAKIGDIVRKWGISHTIEKLNYEKDVHSITNFEEVARNLRYEVFREKCVDQNIRSLLVAHNRDDQLETFLQRLQMNSTMFGLLGLRERAPIPVKRTSPGQNKSVFIYRPLVNFEKNMIRQTCESQSIPWFEDVSNQDVHLTQRNLIRYIINEYVPSAIESRPELECLTRECLSSSVDHIQTTLNTYENQITELESLVKSRDFLFDREKVEITFSIPVSLLMNLQQPILARWLFKIVHPISSAKHFYWSYAKLERQAMPRLWEWLKNPEVDLIMTYLNVRYFLRLVDDKVEFVLTRQAPQRRVVRDYALKVEAGDNAWHLFDRIWWIKINAGQEEVSIRYSDAKIGKQITEAFPDCQNQPLIVPVILNNSGDVLAVPTIGLQKAGVSVSLELKDML